MESSSPHYLDWLQEVRALGGEFAWIRRNNGTAKLHQNESNKPMEVEFAVLASNRFKASLLEIATQRKVPLETVRLEAQKILANMAHDMHLHTAVQPIGYGLTKVFSCLFSNIWVNVEQFAKIRSLAQDSSVPIVWLPTHKSYVDFLLLSLLSYHEGIPLPAICAAEDFQSSRLLGEALRRCGAFFIRRSFRDDALYWAVFSEYVQQLLLKAKRPVEFFLEGQRSRTGKSVYPRTGLLQLVLEPFLRAQLYDTMLVPVTINYDRVLEEQLYANELLGNPKPKETTSGLFKARQILNDTFGEVHVTIGDPISLREYFLGNNASCDNDIRLQLAKEDSEVVAKRIAEEAEKLAMEVVKRQNAKSVLTVWPFLALSMLGLNKFELNNEMPDFILSKFSKNGQILLRIVEKCWPEQKIHRKCKNLDEDFHHFLGLHKTFLAFDTTNDTVSLREIGTSNLVTQFDGNDLLLHAIWLSNCSSPAISILAPLSIFAIAANHGTAPQMTIPDSTENNQTCQDDFIFLRTLFDREFICESSQCQNEFTQLAHSFGLLSDSESAALRHHFLPFLIAYYAILTEFMDSDAQSQTDLLRATLQKLQEEWKRKMQFPAQIVSTDLIKNAFNSLKARQMVKIDKENGVLLDYEGIVRIRTKLGQIIQKIDQRIERYETRYLNKNKL